MRKVASCYYQVRESENCEAWSQKGLSRDEKTLLEVLDHPMSTPELREAAHLPKQRFENALICAREDEAGTSRRQKRVKDQTHQRL